MTIALDTRDDEFSFLLVQERYGKRLGRVRGLLGEVGDRESANRSNHARQKALHYKDPSPAREARQNPAGRIWVGLSRAIMLSVGRAEVAQALHLREAKSKNTGEGRGHGADQVKDGIALLQFEAWVPTAKQVRAAREETGFHDTEDQPEPDHLCPCGQEAEADHCCTP